MSECDAEAGRAATLRVVEPNPSGHRLYYVRVLAEAVLDAGRAAVEWVTTAEAAASSQAQVQLGHLAQSGLFRVRVLDPWPGRTSVLRRVISNHPDDVVCIPDGDVWLPAVAVTLGQGLLNSQTSRVTVLSMRPHTRQKRANQGRFLPLRIFAKAALFRAVRGIAVIRGADVGLFGLVDAFGAGKVHTTRCVVPVRDPVAPRRQVTRAAARLTLGIPDTDLVVGLLGAVHIRKNPGVVARGCSKAFTRYPGRLLVAGRVAPDARVALASSGLPQENLILEDRYIEEVELTAAAAACDVIALVYDNAESASGILALAAQTGTAVLVPPGTALSDVAVVHGFGVTASANADAIAQGLAQIVAQRDGLHRNAIVAAAILGTADFTRALAPDLA